jgi:holo-[acyl-carrier protein] synthase
VEKYMILGVGTDIVRVQRIQDNIKRFGDRFAQRILTHDEFIQYSKSARMGHYLAKRFAAKEAMVKALGTGFQNGLSLRHIAVTHDKMGRPQIICTGRAKELIVEMGVKACFVSISDEQDYAIAFVTIEGT